MTRVEPASGPFLLRALVRFTPTGITTPKHLFRTRPSPLAPSPPTHVPAPHSRQGYRTRGPLWLLPLRRLGLLYPSELFKKAHGELEWKRRFGGKRGVQSARVRLESAWR